MSWIRNSLVALGATTLFLVHRTQDYAEASIRAQQARVTAGRGSRVRRA